ncbi:NAD(P)/FAD-dependent oxidoreductase [Umezawaea sp. Da 62-37]|uniref:NAD(P)/FAD-dependent oxidoreductase n=1 Tax=Umezawaea sp. Da 62-37 TaxID=3075927 RepID=UPI0028F6E02D|nr:NAD(P)/FAD-dependent oxidoreductase [Umezawaea sp. Da 62-37]WNV88461.1 NAD(P)/FAD-dependent oxidoreductase [Umezawaea sp. Da 62-37]
MRVVVVGGGPAGLAAADAAVRAGAEVVLVDSEPWLGGQYHRGTPQHADSRVRHLASSTVWAFEGLRLHVRSGPADSPHRTPHVLDADAVVLATGAHDRVVPFPGWDLPGVYTAGAAQALAKGQGVAVGRRVVVSGTGPFLLPVAESLVRVGARVVEVLEANAFGAWARYPGALANVSKLGELARYATVLGRHRIPVRGRAAVIAAHGDDRVTGVTVARLRPDWSVVDGTRRRIAVDAVCVGHGFTPRLELAVGFGCRLVGGFVAVDGTGATSVPGVYAAGEVTGIGGADLAAAEGAVAGAAAARAPEPPTRALRAVRRGRRFAEALAAAHPVREGRHGWLTPDTLVCRCEEVTLHDLDAALDLGAADVRTIKLASRAGLGLCQGRTCGLEIADLAAARLGHPLPDADAFHRRPLATPLRLGELADAPLLPEEDL